MDTLHRISVRWLARALGGGPDAQRWAREIDEIATERGWPIDAVVEQILEERERERELLTCGDYDGGD
jgi:hypothetical protein